MKLEDKAQFLEKVNTLLAPYELCCYGENLSPALFGIQNTESTSYTNSVFGFWYGERFADIGSYYHKTKAEEIPDDQTELNKILVMAIKFNKFLPLSPIIWVKATTTVKRGKYQKHIHMNGHGPCDTHITDKITTLPDHEFIIVRAYNNRDECDQWFHNGTRITQSTIIPLIKGEKIFLKVERPKETIEYEISL